MPTPATFAETPSDAVGRPCPYCQTGMAEADASAGCGDCGAVHHAECWEENGGCAIPGCPSGPDPNAAATEVVLPVAAPAPGERISITMDDGAGEIRAERQRIAVPTGTPDVPRRGRGRAIAGTLTVVAIVGGAAAFALGGGAGDDDAGALTGSGGGPVVGGVPSVDLSTQEMEATLQTYLSAIKAGDEGKAWALLSNRRTNNLSAGDDKQQRWWDAQQPIRDYLTLSGAEVEAAPLESADDFASDSGTIRLRIKPLGWVSGGSECPAFSGLIWGRWEPTEGKWKLEPELPGFTAVSQFREAEQSKALGYGCLEGRTQTSVSG